MRVFLTALTFILLVGKKEELAFQLMILAQALCALEQMLTSIYAKRYSATEPVAFIATRGCV